MKLKAIGWFFLGAASLFGVEPKTLFISLGSHCEAAVLLRDNNLRYAAYPFDWILSINHKGFLSIIDTDFCFFMDQQSLFQNPVHPQIIDNSVYKIEFSHDWPWEDTSVGEERYHQQIVWMKSKYERRIDRFRELKHYPGRVFFIRTAFDVKDRHYPYGAGPGVETICLEESQEIYNALKRYFPSLDFTLVIVNYKEEGLPPIEAKRILEFKIRKTDRNADYASMFKLLCELDNFNQSLNY